MTFLGYFGCFSCRMHTKWSESVNNYVVVVEADSYTFNNEGIYSLNAGLIDAIIL